MQSRSRSGFPNEEDYDSDSDYDSDYEQEASFVIIAIRIVIVDFFIPAIAICLVSLAPPAAAIAYPAPKPQDLPQKAHGQFGIHLGFSKSRNAFVIYHVCADSPANRAELRQGDEIFRIDGRDVNDGETTLERIASCRPGAIVPVVVRLDDKVRTVLVRPNYKSSETAAEADVVEQPERSTGVIEGVGEEFIQQ